MIEIFRKKHKLWLITFFGACAFPKGEESDLLLDFANIHYRHLKWIGKELIKQKEDFDWDREKIELKFTNSVEFFEMFHSLLKDMNYPQGLLFDRIKADEEYMLSIKPSKNIAITAFSRELTYKNLDRQSIEALFTFLFEEIYKEYELILVYTYAQLHTSNSQLSLIFEDLIYESLYHLKSFCFIASKLGALAVPRVVMKEVYRFDDLKTFLKEGIEEELKAKEQCKALSSLIKDEELSRFFDFINHQEDYHIVLMQEALQAIDK
ncbi:MAG: iron-binding protein [Epsilonproteobacteria bacterium]|nr:iron-binding protein [Campylobacterota bacterium]